MGEVLAAVRAVAAALGKAGVTAGTFRASARGTGFVMDVVVPEVEKARRNGVSVDKLSALEADAAAHVREALKDVKGIRLLTATATHIVVDTR